MTTAECVEVLTSYPKRIPRATRRGMARAMRKVALDAQRIAAQSGILRGLLGHGGHGPVDGTQWSRAGDGLIAVISPRVVGQDVVSGIRAVGIAALQETGGKTRPHTITVGKGKRALTLKGFVHPFATSVRHPGGRVARHPFLVEAVRRNEGLIIGEIEKALAEEVVKLGRMAA